jgi:hypothetical protein
MVPAFLPATIRATRRVRGVHHPSATDPMPSSPQLPITAEDAAPPRRAPSLAWAWLIPGVAVPLLALLEVLHIRGLVDDPFRLNIFYFQFLTHEGDGAVVALACLLFGTALAFTRAGSLLDPLLEWLGTHARLVALACFALLLIGTQLIYRDFPVSMDEYSQTFQAEVFAAGELTGRFPPGIAPLLIPPAFVDYFFVIAPDGRIASKYWPGFSLLMAPFAAVGARWLLNPLLFAVNLGLMTALGRKLLGAPGAVGWVVLLALASPELWANGISYYAMTAHLTCNLAYSILLLRPTPRRLFAAGLVGSLALVLHNPVPHALFAVPWIAWLALGRDRIRRLAALAAGYLPLCLLLGVGWFLFLRADLGPLFSGPSASAAASPEIGDGTQSALEIVGDAFQAPTVASLWGRALGWLKLWLWTAPGLVLLAAFGFARQLREAPSGPATGARTALVLLGVAALTTLLGYVVVPFTQGHGWGFRYFHQGWHALPLLAAAWLSRPGVAASRLARAVGAAALLSVLLAVPLRATQVRGFVTSLTGQLPHLEQQLEPEEVGIYFVDLRLGYYRQDLVRNDPFFRGPLILMLTQGPERDEAVARALLPDPELRLSHRTETLWVASPPDPDDG